MDTAFQQEICRLGRHTAFHTKQKLTKRGKQNAMDRKYQALIGTKGAPNTNHCFHPDGSLGSTQKLFILVVGKGPC